MEYGSRPETAGFRRLEAAQARIDRGEDPHEASRAEELPVALYGDEVRRAVDVAIRIHDAPISLVGELVDVYTLRFALEALDWTPITVGPEGEWHRPDPEEPWLAVVEARTPAGQCWAFGIDTSDIYEQMLYARPAGSPDEG